jgi:hypothetical protein
MHPCIHIKKTTLEKLKIASFFHQILSLNLIPSRNSFSYALQIPD